MLRCFDKLSNRQDQQPARSATGKISSRRFSDSRLSKRRLRNGELLFCGGAAVDKVGDGNVRDARVGGEADLAGAAVGIADGDAFDLGFEFAEGVLVEFRMGHAFVTGETAAAYAFGNNHVGGAHSGQL